MTEAEAKAETDAKAEAKVIITRSRQTIFVYNTGSTDLLGQRDLLRSFETANYLIVGEKQGVDSRDKLKHIERNDQSFVVRMVSVDGAWSGSQFQQPIRL